MRRRAARQYARDTDGILFRGNITTHFDRKCPAQGTFTARLEAVVPAHASSMPTCRFGHCSIVPFLQIQADHTPCDFTKHCDGQWHDPRVACPPGDPQGDTNNCFPGFQNRSGTSLQYKCITRHQCHPTHLNTRISDLNGRPASHSASRMDSLFVAIIDLPAALAVRSSIASHSSSTATQQ